jgi:hypothetical protein
MASVVAGSLETYLPNIFLVYELSQYSFATSFIDSLYLRIASKMRINGRRLQSTYPKWRLQSEKNLCLFLTLS